MNPAITMGRRKLHPFYWGAFGGALGGLAFLPVMILLQPTIWAELVGLLLPALARTPAELLGWVIHVCLLAVWGGLFAMTYRERAPRAVVQAALGWVFVLAWFTVMAVTLIHQSPIPLLGWVLETIAHGAYGAVLAGTLIYVARHGTGEEA